MGEGLSLTKSKKAIRLKLQSGETIRLGDGRSENLRRAREFLIE